MPSRLRWLLLGLAVAGVGLCLSALLRFLTAMEHNGLPWTPGQGIREHYLAVGSSYARGFGVGFFLCFFLALGAVAVAAHFEGRREALRRSKEGPRPPDWASSREDRLPPAHGQ